MGKAWSLVLVIVVAIGFVSFLLDRGSNDVVESVPETRPVVAAATGEPVAATAGDARDEEAARTVSTADAELTVSVVSHDGAFVEGADVSLTALRPSFDAPDWRSRDWAGIASNTVRALTGTDGLARLPVGTAEGTSRVLWVTAPGFVATSRVVAPQARKDSISVALERCDPTRISVIDVAGNAVAWAHVIVRGTGSRQTFSDWASDERIAQCVFYREFTSDALGRVVAGANREECSAIATLESMQSEARVASLDGDFALELKGTCTYSGRVVPDDGVALDHVVVAARRASDDTYTWIATAPVRSDGTFGPVRSPVVQPKMSFLMTGGDVLPTAHDCEVVPGAELDMTFAARRAPKLTLSVTDASANPLAGVVARVQWVDQDGRLCTSQELVTDEVGMATGPRPSAGEVTIGARKRGFARGAIGPTIVDAQHEALFELVLHPGGSILGRVMHAGDPVTDFEVFYWPGGRADQRSQRFTGRRDGVFEIVDVAQTPHLVFASSEAYPRSEIVSVIPEIAPREPAQLDLPGSHRGSGRVIDSETRLPVSSARVSVWNSHGMEAIDQQGDWHGVESDGSFEIVGLRPGVNYVWIEETQYGWTQAMASVEPGGVAEFGDVPLMRGGRLVIQLESETPCDFTTFELFVTGMVNRGPVPFTSGGTVDIEGASVGDYWFLVQYPDESWTRWHGYVKHSGTASFTHTIPAEGQAAFKLRVPDGCVTGSATAAMCYREPDGDRVQREFRCEIGAQTRLDRPPRGSARVLAWNDRGHLANAALTIGAEVRVDIEIDGACEERRFRLVDERGQPVVNTTVVYWCDDESDRMLMGVTSTGEGVIVLPAGECRRYVLYVNGSCQHPAVEVDVEDGIEGPQLVELPPCGTMRVRAVDGEQALSGIKIWAEEARYGRSLRWIGTDSHGRAEWLVPDGKYRLRFAGQRLWPSIIDVEASVAAPPIDVQVRRLGDVAVRVLDGSGGLQATAAIELTSQELGETLSSWIADARVETSTASSSVDSEGRLRIVGVPRGAYRWSVVLADGRAASGVVDVAPWDSTVLDVVVP